MKPHTSKDNPLVAVKSGAEAGLWVHLNSYKPDGVTAENRLFWDPAFYEVVKTDLGRFLPNVERQSGGLPEARYYLYRDKNPNVELCSSSRSVSEVGVPETELALLRRAVVEFQRKAEDATVQHKDLLAAFRLPDPVNCPELYRVDRNGQLLVLWGCRRDELSSLQGRGTVPPGEAVDRLVKYPKAQGGGSRFPWAWLVPLLLLLLLGGWLLTHQGNEPGKTPPVQVIAPQPPHEERGQILVVSWSPEGGEAPVLIKAYAKEPGTIQIGSYDRRAVKADEQVSAPPFTEEGQVLVTWEPEAPNPKNFNGEFKAVTVKKAKAPIPEPPDFVGDLRIRPLAEVAAEGGATKGRYAAELNVLKGDAPELVKHAWEVWQGDKVVADYDRGDEIFFTFQPGEYLIKLKAEDKAGKVLTAELPRSFGASQDPAKKTKGHRLAVRESAPRKVLENGRTRCFVKAEPPVEDGAPASLGEHFWTVYLNDEPVDLKDGPAETPFDLLPGRHTAKVTARTPAGVLYQGALELNVEAPPSDPKAAQLLAIAEERRTLLPDGRTLVDLRAKPQAHGTKGEAVPAFADKAVHWEARKDKEVAAAGDAGLETGLSLSPGRYTLVASAVDKTGRKFVGAREVNIDADSPDSPPPEPPPPAPPGQPLSIQGTAGAWHADGKQRWDFSALQPTRKDGSVVPLQHLEWKISQGGAAVGHRGKDLQTAADLAPGPFQATVKANDAEGKAHEALLEGEVGPATGQHDQHDPMPSPLPLVLKMATPKAVENDPDHLRCRVIASTTATGGSAPDLSPYHWQVDKVADTANQEKVAVFTLTKGVHDIVVTAKDSDGRLYRGAGKLPVGVPAPGESDKEVPIPRKPKEPVFKQEQNPGDLVSIKVAQFGPGPGGVGVRCQLVLAPARERGATPPFKNVVWNVTGPSGQMRTTQGADRVSFELSPGRHMFKVKALDANDKACSTTASLTVDDPVVEHVDSEEEGQNDGNEKHGQKGGGEIDEDPDGGDNKGGDNKGGDNKGGMDQPPPPPIEDGLRIKKTPVVLEPGRSKSGTTTFKLEATLTQDGQTLPLTNAVWLIDGTRREPVPGTSFIQVEWQDGTKHEVEVSKGKLSLKNQY